MSRVIQSFIIDPNLKPVEIDKRIDLLAANAPVVATGKFICFEYQVPEKQTLLVAGLAVYAMQRINPGSPDESFQMIQPADGNGFFTFEPQVNGASPYIVQTDYNAPQIASTTDNNNVRQRSRGISMLSLDPRKDAHEQWINPLYGFVVPPQQTLQIIFSILPPPTATALVVPLPTLGQYTIGVNATKRVDFAGAFIVGEQISAQHYNKMVIEAKNDKDESRAAAKATMRNGK